MDIKKIQRAKEFDNLPDLPEVRDAKKEWYDNIWVLLGAILVAGPFAIPIVWMAKTMKKEIKIALTIFLVIEAVLLVNVTMKFYNYLMTDMTELSQVPSK